MVTTKRISVGVFAVMFAIAGMFAALASVASPASAVPGDGTADDVQGDEIGEADDIVKDVVLEQATNVWQFAAWSIGILLGLALIWMVMRKILGRFKRIGSGG